MNEVCFRNVKSKVLQRYLVGNTEHLIQQHKQGINTWERGKDQKQISEDYLHGCENHH